MYLYMIKDFMATKQMRALSDVFYFLTTICNCNRIPGDLNYFVSLKAYAWWSMLNSSNTSKALSFLYLASFLFSNQATLHAAGAKRRFVHKRTTTVGWRLEVIGTCVSETIFSFHASLCTCIIKSNLLGVWVFYSGS